MLHAKPPHHPTHTPSFSSHTCLPPFLFIAYMVLSFFSPSHLFTSFFFSSHTCPPCFLFLPHTLPRFPFLSPKKAEAIASAAAFSAPRANSWQFTPPSGSFLRQKKVGAFASTTALNHTQKTTFCRKRQSFEAQFPSPLRFRRRIFRPSRELVAIHTPERLIFTPKKGRGVCLYLFWRRRRDSNSCYGFPILLP